MAFHHASNHRANTNATVCCILRPNSAQFSFTQLSIATRSSQAEAQTCLKAQPPFRPIHPFLPRPQLLRLGVPEFLLIQPQIHFNPLLCLRDRLEQLLVVRKTYVLPRDGFQLVLLPLRQILFMDPTDRGPRFQAFPLVGPNWVRYRRRRLERGHEHRRIPSKPRVVTKELVLLLSRSTGFWFSRSLIPRKLDHLLISHHWYHSVLPSDVPRP